MRLTDLHNDLAALREDLARELEAISRLEAQTFTLNDQTSVEHIRQIADDKKAHAAALVRAIATLDPKFGERLG